MNLYKSTNNRKFFLLMNGYKPQYLFKLNQLSINCKITSAVHCMNSSIHTDTYEYMLITSAQPPQSPHEK